MSTTNQEESKGPEIQNEIEIFLSEEDVLYQFNIAQKIWMEYEDCQNNTPFEDAIVLLKKIEQSIIHHSMFSPNEPLKDLKTEYIKLLLVPFFLADVFGRFMENRRTNLKLSKSYYDEFIKLCNHYELVTKEQRKQWKTIFDDENYEPTREEKILSFKEKKDLDNKIKNLEKIKDEDSQREILLLNVKTKILKALEDIRLCNMALKMEAHREKVEKEKQSNPNYKEEKLTPKPLKVWHVPKDEKNPDQPYLMNPNAHHGCEKCDPLYNMKQRQDLIETVFQPGYSQPTMRLADYADMYQKQMNEMEERNKWAQEREKLKGERDQDKDEAADEQTYKDREWDDWKDENEKGAGNKKR